jgi:hypothetical protein
MQLTVMKKLPNIQKQNFLFMNISQSFTLCVAGHIFTTYCCNNPNYSTFQSKHNCLFTVQNSYMFCLYSIAILMLSTRIKCIYLQLYRLRPQNTMGMNCCKIVYATPAHIHQYKNLKQKWYSCNANTYSNQGIVQRIWLYLTDLNW